MGQPRGELSTVEGDIVVTPLAGRYAIGRVTADAKRQTMIEMQRDRAGALTRACELAGDEHRVFLAHSLRHGSVLVNRSLLAQYAQDSEE